MLWGTSLNMYLGAPMHVQSPYKGRHERASERPARPGPSWHSPWALSPLPCGWRARDGVGTRLRTKCGPIPFSKETRNSLSLGEKRGRPSFPHAPPRGVLLGSHSLHLATSELNLLAPCPHLPRTPKVCPGDAWSGKLVKIGGERKEKRRPKNPDLRLL